MTDSTHCDDCAPHSPALLSLVPKLEQLGKTLSAAERRTLLALVDHAIAPSDRLLAEEPAQLFSDEQAALLDELEEPWPEPESDYATLIVKATRRCNLRCSYCNDWRNGAEAEMGFDVLARTICAALREYRQVHFVWHGGETTLLPISYYKKALAIQARFKKPTQTVTNSLQTNGTRITPDWAQFLFKARIGVGISIDGPREIHDRVRRYPSGRGSFADAIDGLEVIRGLDIAHSVLLVVDRATLELGADRLFDFCLANGITNYCCLNVKPDSDVAATATADVPHYVDSREMAAFLARLYDRWLEHGDFSIRIRELDGIRARLMNKPSRYCRLEGSCLGKYFTVEPNGEVTHCDCFSGCGAEYSFGNIARDGFAGMAKSDRLQELVCREEATLQASCGQCSEFHVCSGGCAHDRYIAARYDGPDATARCGSRQLIEHIRSRMHLEAEPTPRNAAAPPA